MLEELSSRGFTRPRLALVAAACVLAAAGSIGSSQRGGRLPDTAWAAVPSIGMVSTTGTITAGGMAVLRARPTPLKAGLRTIILRSTVDGGSWRRVGRMVWSDATRKYSLSVRPSVSTYLRAVWYDAAGHVKAVSPKVRVLVRPKVRVYATSNNMVWGRLVRFYGSVWPKHPRRRVRIQLKLGRWWTTIFAPRIDYRGRFRTGYYKPRLRGSYVVRAVLSKPDWDHLGGVSPARRLNVRTSTMMREGRAVWVTRWSYRSRYHIRRIMHDAWKANLNIVYWQVRGQGDAYYRSHYEPWASRLAGRLGRDPGWDPLQYAVKIAHSYGLKLHAWVNVYPIWMGKTAPPRTTRPHIYYKGGMAWRVARTYRSGGRWRFAVQRLNAGYLWGSPGNPDLRAHIKRVIADIASNYDVDGVQLDRVEYPSRGYSWDRASRMRYAAANAAYKTSHRGKTLSRAVWQRREVTRLVRETYALLRGINPEIQVSAATAGIYLNRWGWPGVRQGATEHYQDSQEWTRGGIVDFLAPKIYSDMDHVPKWGTVVADFASRRNGRFVYPAVAAYLYRNNWKELRREVDASASLGAQGVSFFDYTSLTGRFRRLWAIFPEMVDPPVRGSSTALSLDATTTAPVAGQNLDLFGTLVPDQAGARVYVLRYAITHWDLVASTTTNSTSKYRVVWRVPPAGNYRLRVIFKGDATRAGASSLPLLIRSHT